MYQTKVIGDKLFHVQSDGYGESIALFGAKTSGETPMSLLNIALASCVTMCVQGYFKKYYKENKVEIETTSLYDDEAFQLTIEIEHDLSEAEIPSVLDYIDVYCSVKKHLRPDLKIDIKIISKNSA